MSIILILFISGLQISLNILFYPKVNIVYMIFSLAIYAIFLISFLITFLTNPGIPTRDLYLSKEIRNIINRDTESNEGYLTCNICNVFVKSDIKIGHCLSCKICILGYDHHCGWSSKCIGQGNIKSFWIFLVTILIFFVYNSSCLVVSSFISID